MTTPRQPALGPWLIQRARDHGISSYQLADMLGLPHHRLQQLRIVRDLDDLPMRLIRRVAEALNLTWPDWLHPYAGPYPRPVLPDPGDTGADQHSWTSNDAARIHALLALALDQPFTYQQIAELLDWPLDRVHAALALISRPWRGLRVVDDGTTATLTTNPRALPAGTRERLQLLQLKQSGPSPALAYLVYRISTRQYNDAIEIANRRADTIHAAQAAGLLTYTLTSEGRPTDLQLSPEVAFSLGIVTELHSAMLLDPE